MLLFVKPRNLVAHVTKSYINAAVNSMIIIIENVVIMRMDLAEGLVYISDVLFVLVEC